MVNHSMTAEKDTFRISATRRLPLRIDVWPDSIQVIGGTLSFAAAHPGSGCGSHLDCDPSTTVTRSGSRGVCPARSSDAHLVDSFGFQARTR